MSEGMLEARPAQAEKERDAGAVQMNMAGEPVLCEANGDYTLPDYQPEIRKILHVRPAVLPTGKFISGGRAEFSGTVAHSVLYADADGHLAAALLPGEYTFRAELPEGENTAVLCDSMAEGTVCRPGGPRKLTLRTMSARTSQNRRSGRHGADRKGAAGRRAIRPQHAAPR